MPDQQTDKKIKRYVNMPRLCGRWSDCSPMTVERKLANDPDFPKPIQLTPGGRRLWDLEEIEAYERKAAARSRTANAAKEPQRRRAGSARP
jgi:hypothetical protein